MTPTTPPTPAIDFADIRSRCPRAFAALIAWFTAGKAFQYKPTANSAPPDPEMGRISRDWLDTRDGQLSLGDFRYAYDLNPRDLFDFFDEQGVYVVVDRLVATGAWYWEISGDAILLWQNPEQPTRTAAEAAAFTSAFEKLEEILTKREG